MSTISTDALVGHLVAALNESFDGPAADVFYFADKQGGLFPSIDGLSAEAASRRVGSDSVAGQVGHIVFCLRYFAGAIRGNPPQMDWPQSWATNTVDAAGWDRLKAELRAAHTDTREAIAKHAADSTEAAAAAVGAVTHTIYHLGALRKILAVLRKG
jgi:hypothetical protein